MFKPMFREHVRGTTSPRWLHGFQSGFFRSRPHDWTAPVSARGSPRCWSSLPEYRAIAQRLGVIGVEEWLQNTRPKFQSIRDTDGPFPPPDSLPRRGTTVRRSPGLGGVLQTSRSFATDAPTRRHIDTTYYSCNSEPPTPPPIFAIAGRKVPVCGGVPRGRGLLQGPRPLGTPPDRSKPRRILEIL